MSVGYNEKCDSELRDQFFRFFMARKGILPRRKRGRASGAPFMSDIGGNSNRDREHSRSASPSEPPFHFANYKLPDLKHELL